MPKGFSLSFTSDPCEFRKFPESYSSRGNLYENTALINRKYRSSNSLYLEFVVLSKLNPGIRVFFSHTYVTPLNFCRKVC